MARKPTPRTNPQEAADPRAPAAGVGNPGTNTRESEAEAAGVSPAARGAAPQSHVGDPYWGRGGRYIVGPDGIRRPAEQPEN